MLLLGHQKIPVSYTHLPLPQAVLAVCPPQPGADVRADRRQPRAALPHQDAAGRRVPAQEHASALCGARGVVGLHPPQLLSLIHI